MSRVPQFVLLAVVLSAPAVAQTPPPPASPPIVVEASRKVCRTEQTTGSRTAGKRTCRTEAEWAQADDEARRQFESEIARSRAWTGGKPQ